MFVAYLVLHTRATSWIANKFARGVVGRRVDDNTELAARSSTPGAEIFFATNKHEQSSCSHF